MAAVPPLPDGSALLHIGPHKTGTTSLQVMLHRTREQLLAAGVRYASATRHDSDGPRLLTAGADHIRGSADAALRSWQQVVAAMRDTAVPRRVFSSETLANADAAAVERIIEDLGRERTEVVITLRPLASIVPSQYQQFVQRGQTTAAFEPWLASLLGRDTSVSTWPFWHRHRHDELLARWAAPAGIERVSVVVLDPSDHVFLPHVFEQLLGLPAETLAGQDVRANRSLTAAETELIRRWHQDNLAAEPDWRRRRTLMTRTARYLRKVDPTPSAPRLGLPAWALAEVEATAARMVERIGSSGARVIGDLAGLRAVPASTRSVTTLPADIDEELTQRFAVGLRRARRALTAEGSR